MKAFHSSIVAVALSEELFKEYVLEDEHASHNTALISPLGNIFVVGDTDKIEEFLIDKDNVEYILHDSISTRRKILFHKGYSDFGIFMMPNGTPNVTDGIGQVVDDDPEWKEFVMIETGQIGQELSDYEEDELVDDGDEHE